MAAHRYLRIYGTTSARNYIGFAEVELRGSAGGADLTVPGGAATASNAYGGYPATNCVDNNPATLWTSYTAQAPQWWKYDFGTPTDVKEIVITPRQDGYPTEAPSEFYVQVSDDDATWQTAIVYTGLSWTAAAKTFAVPDAAQPPSAAPVPLAGYPKIAAPVSGSVANYAETPSFTPPANALLVAIGWVSEDFTAAIQGGGLTWNQAVVSDSYPRVYAWWAVAPATPAAMAARITASGSCWKALTVYALDKASTAGLGATAKRTTVAASAPWTFLLSPQAADSLLLFGVAASSNGGQAAQSAASGVALDAVWSEDSAWRKGAAGHSTNALTQGAAYILGVDSADSSITRFMCVGVEVRSGPALVAPRSVTGIAPTHGSALGGTSVTITGSGFTGATGATVGGVALTDFAVASDTAITGVTGAHAAGAVDVVVGSATLAGGYTYDAVPLAISLGATVGSTAGGEVIRLTATGDAADAITSIAFDATSATFEDAGTGLYDVTVPAHSAGSVTVTATAGSETATATYEYAVAASSGYTIFLQLRDGTVDAIPCSPGADDRHVILARAPRLPLQTDPANFARATYQIVRNDSPRERAFLVQEKEGREGLTCVLRAVAYDDRFYQNDHDVVAEDELPWRAGAGTPGGPSSDPNNPNPNLVTDGTFDLGTGWTETEEPPAEVSIANGRAILEYGSIFQAADKTYLEAVSSLSRAFTVASEGTYFLGVELSAMNPGEKLIASVTQGGETAATLEATANGWTTSTPFALSAGMATLTLTPERTDGSHVSGSVWVESVEVRAPRS